MKKERNPKLISMNTGRSNMFEEPSIGISLVDYEIPNFLASLGKYVHQMVWMLGRIIELV
jgi:hypothetical protein